MNYSGIRKGARVALTSLMLYAGFETMGFSVFYVLYDGADVEKKERMVRHAEEGGLVSKIVSLGPNTAVMLKHSKDSGNWT